MEGGRKWLWAVQGCEGMWVDVHASCALVPYEPRYTVGFRCTKELCIG